MYLLLFLAIFSVVYVKSFSDNFTKEHLDKVTPFLILIVAFSVALCVLTSLV